ncbi:MAG TPA: hypothetical protein VEF76_10475 [Patescibacteria group bacterium]|nr:hypothetical protein [Patescibacteria group bacterium]
MAYRNPNIMRLLPGAAAPSKEELAAYWTKVHKKALPYLARRPLTLVRQERGQIFFHKGGFASVPNAVHQLQIEKREGGSGTRLWVDDLAGLLGLVEMGVIEVHPWQSTIDNIEMADMIIFDLDPGPGVPWRKVTESALSLRRFLGKAGLKSWPKLSGGKGIHVMVPLPEPFLHDDARELSQQLAAAFAGDRKLYTLSSAPSEREGRIFIDYLRNGRGTTAVGAWSPRARPGFAVATPTTWTRIEKGERADAYPMQRFLPAQAAAGRHSREEASRP